MMLSFRSVVVQGHTTIERHWPNSVFITLEGA